MEKVHKIKIKLENIWIDLIRGIYAPYISPLMAEPMRLWIVDGGHS